MTEKLWDFEITVGGDPSRLLGTVKSVEDAIARAKTASLTPFDELDREITIKLTPRPTL